MFGLQGTAVAKSQSASRSNQTLRRKTAREVSLSCLLLDVEQEPQCGEDSLCRASDVRENVLQANYERKEMEESWKRKPLQSLKAIQLSVMCPILGLGDQIRTLRLW